MTIREQLEEREHKILSPFAAYSDESRGRDRYEEACDIRPVYQRDRDRILHSKSFRRMKGKTQVFLAPAGDHYRTRMTHTLEVSQNARTVAKALRLNEDLTEAVALGHDLGHTPFGHAGRDLSRWVSSSGTECPAGGMSGEGRTRAESGMGSQGRNPESFYIRQTCHPGGKDRADLR